MSTSNSLLNAYGHMASQRSLRRANGPGLLFRRYPHLTMHTYMPVVSPAFTQQAASVRRSNENMEYNLFPDVPQQRQRLSLAVASPKSFMDGQKN